MNFTRMILAAALALPLLAACGDKETVTDIHAISAEGVGEQIGIVRARDSADGLVFDIEIAGLAGGPHGFHVHENGDCGPAEKDGKMTAGLAAGGHYDPDNTGTHLGPEGTGHRGDLPALIIAPSGVTTVTLIAPRLTLGDIRGHALVIHEMGDNYSDDPKPLGGGGARVACGVVP